LRKVRAEASRFWPSDRPVVRFRQDLLMDRTGFETLPDHRIDVRITRQQRAVAMVH
jgi:hypothetical protein